MTKYTPLTLSSQPRFKLNGKKYVYFIGKSEEALENLKTFRNSYLCLDLSKERPKERKKDRSYRKTPIQNIRNST